MVQHCHPVGCNGVATTLHVKPNDAQIVGTGLKFMIVHLGNAWIDLDVIVAHAPHSWDTKHQEGVEEVTYAFWEQLQLALTKRAKPHAPLFFLAMPISSDRQPRRAMKALGNTNRQKRPPTMQALLVSSWRQNIWHCHVRTKDATRAKGTRSKST